jgi:hypothetical protein
MCFSPLTFASFVFSLLSTSLSFRFLHGWTISCLYPNRFVSSKVHLRQREQASLVGGVEKETLVSGVAEFDMVLEDPIV